MRNVWMMSSLRGLCLLAALFLPFTASPSMFLPSAGPLQSLNQSGSPDDKAEDTVVREAKPLGLNLSRRSPGPSGAGAAVGFVLADRIPVRPPSNLVHLPPSPGRFNDAGPFSLRC
jgi:hypothetical protein